MFFDLSEYTDFSEVRKATLLFYSETVPIHTAEFTK